MLLLMKYFYQTPVLFGLEKNQPTTKQNRGEEREGKLLLIIEIHDDERKNQVPRPLLKYFVDAVV